MINNSFYINIQRGTIEGCGHARQTLLYFLGYWQNGEGAFYMKYLICLFSFKAHKKKKKRIIYFRY